MKLFTRLFFLLIAIKCFAQPANDDCSGSVNIVLVNGWTAPLSGTVLNATQVIPPNANCNNTSSAIARDVWYRFTATAAIAKVQVIPSNSFDPGVEVFSGSCTNRTVVTCIDRGGGLGFPETFTMTSLTIGNTYYIRVYHFTRDAAVRPVTSTFTISIYSTIPTPGVPSINASTGSVGCIDVDWTPVTGTSYYELFQDDVSLGRITGLTKTKCGLVAGSNHCYKVRACNSSGVCSAFSNIDCATAGQNQVSSYTISATAVPQAGGSVTGAGSFEDGSQATLVATPNTNYTFLGWYENGTQVHATATYSFSVTEDRTLEARFKRIPITYTVNVNNGFVAAPWQRLNENYTIDFNVKSSDGSDFYLYYKSGNNPEQSKGPFPSNTALSTTLQFTNVNQIGTVTYRVGDGTDYKQLSQTTAIIQKFEAQNSFCVDNTNNDGYIEIPIKYIPEATSYSISFTREDKVSNKITGNFENINLSTLTKSMTSGNEIYRIRVGGTGDNNIHPGKFYFTIHYNSNRQITESGSFFLTKIGRIGNLRTPLRVIVVVGGWTNTIEDDVKVSPYNIGHTFSVANYFAQNNQVWYIAQPNNDWVENNAYALGKALEEIKKITMTNEIHIICHSKGGLDLRTMLTNINVPRVSSSRIKDYDANKFSFLYDNSNINGTIKSITFLATPHNGASFTGDIAALYSASRWGSNSRGVQDLTPHAISAKFGNANSTDTRDVFTVPSNIQFLNMTGYSYLIEDRNRPIPKIVGDFVVGIEDSRNPYLILRDRSKAAVIQNYVNLSLLHHILSFNDLNTYSMYDIVGHLSIHKVSFLDKNHYFPLNCNYTPLDNIGYFINGRSNIETCKNKVETLLSLLGSTVSGASVEIRDNSTFSGLGYTDEQGILRNVTPRYIATGDTMRITAVGYDTLVSRIENEGSNSYKIAMLKTTNPERKIMYPKVTTQINETFTTSDNVNLNVTGENMRNYDMWNIDDSTTTFRQRLAQDSSINVNVKTGDNYFMVRMMGTDTIYWVKRILRLPADSLNDYTYKVNLNVNSSNLGAMLYVENKFVKKIDRLNDSFRLLNVYNKINISQFGYQDTTIWLAGQDTNLSINLNSRYRYTPQDSNIINFSTLGKVQYWNGVTVKNSNPNGRLSLKRYDKNYSNLRLITKSETFEYQSLTPSVTALKTGIILDVPTPPQYDSIYMLKIMNGNTYEKIFTPQFQYEEAFQKILIDSFALNGNTKLVLMKKQKPIKNTTTGLRVHQSETLIIPLSDLFKDPDNIPNDMTYRFTAHNDLDILIIRDSVRIRHKTCNAGHLSFTLAATHDQLTIVDTFNIDVTPLSITSKIRPARCFNTPTGRIDMGISSNQPILYSYSWTNFARGRLNDSIYAGSYSITVSDQNNCTVLKTMEVTQPTPVTVSLGADIKLDLGDSLELAPSVNRQFISLWKWIPSTFLSCDSCERPSTLPLYNIEYKIIATDTAGCSGRDTLKITVFNKRKVFIPTAFSPNNDGQNDIFMVFGGREVRKISKFYIFNRWGAKVFGMDSLLPNDPSKGWNGTFNGQQVETGVYIYTLEVEYINGKTELFSGDVSVIR